MKYNEIILYPFSLITIALVGLYFVPGCSKDPVATNNYEPSWVQTRGPYGGWVPTISVSPNGYVFAGVWRKPGYHNKCDGLYRSKDNCNSWQHVNADSGTPFSVWRCIINSKGHLFVYSLGTVQAGPGVYRSLDNGNSWAPVWEPSGLTVGLFALNSSDHLFVIATSREGDSSAVYRSMDNGDSWLKVTDFNALSLAINSQDHLFAGSSDAKIYGSTDNGDNWTVISISPDNSPVGLVIDNNDQIFAMTQDFDIYRSVDAGENWAQINIELNNAYIFSLEINQQGEIYAGSDSCIFYSGDSGDNWTKLSSDILNSAVWSLAFSAGGHIYAGTEDGGIIRITSNGENWETVGAPIAEISSILINPSDDIFASADLGLYRSSDGGDSWTKLSFEGSPKVVSSNGIIYANDNGLWRSVDNGGSWDFVNPNTYNHLSMNSEGYIFGASGYQGVNRSIDSGESWEQIAEELVDIFIVDITIDKNDNIYVSSDVPPPPPPQYDRDAASGMFYCSPSDSDATAGVYHSIDNGDNWTFIGGPGGGQLTTSVTGHIFSLAGGSIYRTYHNSDNWVCISCDNSAGCLVVNSIGTVYIAKHGGISYSTDNGDSWKSINSGFGNRTTQDLTVNSKDVIFAGTRYSGIFRLE